MTSHNVKVAILASGDRKTGGGGSTMARFIRDTQEGIVAAEVGLVVCNNPRGTVGVYDHVDTLNSEYGLDIEALTINGVTRPKGKQERGQTLEEASAICRELGARGIEYVLCLGYMKQLNGELVQEYGWHPEFEAADPKNRGIYLALMANTHPGILPETADTYGIGASERALELGLRATAHTLHVVSAGIDRGPPIAEHLVPILAGDTAEHVFDNVQDVEKANIGPAMNRYFAEWAAHLEH